MSSASQHIISRFQKRWQLLLVVQVMLYALCAALLMYMLSRHLGFAIGAFAIVTAVGILFQKPWAFTTQKTTQFLDEHLSGMENSTGLLLAPETELSSLALLQSHKVAKRLPKAMGEIRPNVSLKKPILWVVGFALVTALVMYFNPFTTSEQGKSDRASKEQIVFQALDSSEIKTAPPVLTSQKLTIQYPAYTKLASRSTSNMNVKAVEGSKVYWNIAFDTPVDSVFMEREAQPHPMKPNGKSYQATHTLTGSSFYNFKFVDLQGTAYLSDLYAIEMLEDAVPEIEIQNLKQFSTFEIGASQQLTFKTRITDDYGVSDAYIIATVTKGEGESVKFREERIPFDDGLAKGTKKQNLKQTIDLAALKMEAGDELYFYVEALDEKTPKANRARSETYFAVIRDTTNNSFAVEGTMGADLMPDYFRSQRQLIIDTEKLLADKNKLSKKEFNSISNELGYDQKALRLKYGQFMGDEADSGIQTQTIEVEEQPDENDPLADYTHDHDGGSNEHNLVEHAHEEEAPDAPKENPLDAYLHNHDDPEAATLFSQSLKGKLRQAMTEMWDAELHLRLYTPENSLPYQYRALKLIQEIKNSARIYVHRIGFDPPPLKEDKRLTGTLDGVKTVQKKEALAKEDAAIHLRKTVARISELLAMPSEITDTDRQLFKTAGNELAVMAIEKPGSYLKTLQRLKWLSERAETSTKELGEIQSGLLTALPVVIVNPSKQPQYDGELNTLMLKELDGND